MITHWVRFLPPACTHNRQLEEKRGGWGRAGSQKSICVSFSLPLPPLKTPSASRGGRAEKIEVKNKKDINKEIRVFHIRSADWWRRQSGRSGPQLHSLFSELFYTVQPSDSNECWLWPLVSGYSGNCIRYKRVCVRLRASPRGDGRGVLDFRAVVRASRGAQSTVDGFYAIHTKLTDSVECSPRQAARRHWGKVTDGGRGARAFWGGRTVDSGQTYRQTDDDTWSPSVKAATGAGRLQFCHVHCHLITQTSCRLFHPPLPNWPLAASETQMRRKLL